MSRVEEPRDLRQGFTKGIFCPNCGHHFTPLDGASWKINWKSPVDLAAISGWLNCPDCHNSYKIEKMYEPLATPRAESPQNPHGWTMCKCPKDGDKRCKFDCVCHETLLPVQQMEAYAITDDGERAESQPPREEKKMETVTVPEAPTAKSIAKWCGCYESEERFEFVVKGLEGMLERLRNSQFANLEQCVDEFFVDDFDNGPGTLGPLLFRNNTAFGYDKNSPVGQTVSLALCRDLKEWLKRVAEHPSSPQVNREVLMKSVRRAQSHSPTSLESHSDTGATVHAEPTASEVAAPDSPSEMSAEQFVRNLQKKGWHCSDHFIAEFNKFASLRTQQMSAEIARLRKELNDHR